MTTSNRIHSISKPSTRVWFFVACFFALAAGVGWPQSGAAATAQEKLDSAESRIEKGKGREQVLTSEIEDYGNQISELSGQVDALRQQESAAESELAAKQAEIDTAGRVAETLGKAIALLHDRSESADSTTED